MPVTIVKQANLVSLIPSRVNRIANDLMRRAGCNCAHIAVLVPLCNLLPSHIVSSSLLLRKGCETYLVDIEDDRVFVGGNGFAAVNFVRQTLLRPVLIMRPPLFVSTTGNGDMHPCLENISFAPRVIQVRP